jgi:hypothetical protein
LSLVLVAAGSTALTLDRDRTVAPRLVADAGHKTARRFLEFFAATTHNQNTRMAYFRACTRFLARCVARHIGKFADIEPLHVAAYVQEMGRDFEKPTVKQHLATIRMLFDWLVTGQIVAINPAHAVRGSKHITKRGKTPVLTPDEAQCDPGPPLPHQAQATSDASLIAKLTGSMCSTSPTPMARPPRPVMAVRR